MKLIETSILNILNLGKDPGKTVKVLISIGATFEEWRIFERLID